MESKYLPDEIWVNIYEKMDIAQLEKLRTTNRLANDVFIERRKRGVEDLANIHHMHPYITILDTTDSDLIGTLAGSELVKLEAENLRGNNKMFHLGLVMGIPKFINESIDNTCMVQYFQLLKELQTNTELRKKLEQSPSTKPFLKLLLSNRTVMEFEFIREAGEQARLKWYSYVIYMKRFELLPKGYVNYIKRDIAYIYYYAGYNQDFEYIYKMIDYNIADFASGLRGYYTATGSVTGFLNEFRFLGLEHIFPISGTHYNPYSVYQLVAKLADKCNILRSIYPSIHAGPLEVIFKCNNYSLPPSGVIYLSTYTELANVKHKVDINYSYTEFIHRHGLLSYQMLNEILNYDRIPPSEKFVLATYHDDFSLLLQSNYFQGWGKIPIYALWLCAMVNGYQLTSKDVENRRYASRYDIDVIAALIARSDNFMELYMRFINTFSNDPNVFKITLQLIGSFNMVELRHFLL